MAASDDAFEEREAVRRVVRLALFLGLAAAAQISAHSRRFEEGQG